MDLVSVVPLDASISVDGFVSFDVPTPSSTFDGATILEPVCLSGPPLLPGVALERQHTWDGAIIDTSNGCLEPFGDARPVRLYALTLPAHTRAAIHVPTDIVAARVSPACALRTCLGAGTGPTLVDNPRDEPLDTIIAITSLQTPHDTHDVVFSIDASVYPLSPPSTSTAMCAEHFARDFDPSGDEAYGFILDDDDPDRIYHLHITAETGVRFEPPMEEYGRCDLCVQPACGEASAATVACGQRSPDRRHEALLWRVFEPGDYAVRFTALYSPSWPSSYSLHVSTFAPAEHCEAAPDTIVARNIDEGVTAPVGCAPPDTSQLFARWTVPAGRRGRFSVHGFQGDQISRLLDSCAATTCLALARHSDFDGGRGVQADTMFQYDNFDYEPRSFVVAISPFPGPLPSVPLVTTQTETLPIPVPILANDICLYAPAFPLGSSVVGTTLSSRTPATGGNPFTSGRAVFYTAEVPAGRTLHVRFMPFGRHVFVVRIRDGCDSDTDLAQAICDDDYTEPCSHLDLTQTNATSRSQTFVIEIDGSTPTDEAAFQLTATVE